MVSKCVQLFVVTLVMLNVLIHGCIGINQSRHTGENSAVSDKFKDHDKNLDIVLRKTFLETNTTKSSNKYKDKLREVARKKGDSKEESMMDKILPVLIIPFLISSSMIPAMLLSIKFLMIKSAIIGKIAVILMLLNFFRRRVDTGGVYNHYPGDLMKEHYGYQGVEEPGAYVNKKRRKRHLR